MDRAWLTWTLILGLGPAARGAALDAALPFCAASPSVPEPSQVAAVTLDTGGVRRSFRYAFGPDGSVVSAALVGMSHEYTCHLARENVPGHPELAQPELAQRYCSFANVDGVLDAMAKDGLNVFRLYGVFNHGLGASLGEREPYPFEQPFVRVGSAWDLSRLEPVYLERLESVVRAAYCRRLIVELTLLDPWDGEFTTSPFANANTVGGRQGLSQRADFLRPGNRAQAFQKAAVTAIVERLRRYPNVIWEVANEPDLAPDGISVAEIAAFERQVIDDWIAPLDTAHLVMANGHQEGVFGWRLPRVAVASAHYVELADGRVGALEMLLRPEVAVERSRIAFGFNEGKALGSDPEIDAEDVRIEAWEFLFAGGSLFDAYSVDRGSVAARAASAELGVLARLFRSRGDAFDDLAALGPAVCGEQGWCDRLPAATAKAGDCAAGGAEIRTVALASADRSSLALYVRRARTVATPGAPQGVFRRYDAAHCGPLGLEGFTFRAPTEGCWRLRWIEPRDGSTVAERRLRAEAGVVVAFPMLSEATDAAFFARREAGGCPGGSD